MAPAFSRSAGATAGPTPSRTFDRHADAQAFEAERRRGSQLGPLAVQQLTERHGPTLGQWITDRWAPEHGVTLAQSTRERYSEVYATHCAALDGLALAEITVGRIRAWQAERVKAGVQPGTIHNVDRWAPACRAAGIDRVPRPYDLRHSFASLLLAEGHPPMYVAQQLGHSVATVWSSSC